MTKTGIATLPSELMIIYFGTQGFAEPSMLAYSSPRSSSQNPCSCGASPPYSVGTHLAMTTGTARSGNGRYIITASTIIEIARRMGDMIKVQE